MRYRRGLKPALRLIDEIILRARITKDVEEKNLLNRQAQLMLAELREETRKR